MSTKRNQARAADDRHLMFRLAMAATAVGLLLAVAL